MRNFSKLIILVRTLLCILPKEIISEVNELVFENKKLHSSILNPFFGHIFHLNMLHNLRFYYYGIDPDYNNKGERNHVKDKGRNGLATVLINFFPSPGGNLCTTTTLSSNLAALNFLDSDIRTHSIKIFALFFVNILKMNSQPIEYYNNEENIIVKEKLDSLQSTLKKLSNKIITSNLTNEEHCLVLLTIHSFMIDIIVTREEYSIYLFNITAMVSISELKKNSSYFFTNLEITDLDNNSKLLISSFLYTLNTNRCNYNIDTILESNSKVPVYDRETDKFNSEKFADCVEITLLHLCNFIFYEEENNSYNLDHLELDDNSDLYLFYKKYKNPSTITEDVRKDWCKVVQCLNTIKYVGSENVWPIDYCKKEFRNEIRSNIINVVTVLTSLCITSKKNIVSKYIELFAKGVTTENILEKFTEFLCLLKKDHRKITCTQDYIAEENGKFYLTIFIVIVNTKDKYFNKTVIKFHFLKRHANAQFIYGTSSPFKIPKNMRISIPKDVPRMPLDYLIIEYNKHMINKENLDTERSMIDRLYNCAGFHTTESMINHLYDLYEYVDSAEKNDICKLISIIVKSLRPKFIFNLTELLPFFLKVEDFSHELRQDDIKLNIWLYLNYKFGLHKNNLINLWEKEIDKINWKKLNYTLRFDKECMYIKSLEALSRTGIEQITFRSKGDVASWENIFDALKKLRNLKNISIDHIWFNHNDIIYFCNFLNVQNHNLTSLSFSKCSLDSIDLELICKTFKHENNNISEFYYYSCSTHEELLLICDVLEDKNNKLTILTIKIDGITLLDVNRLGEAIVHENCNLKSFSLEYSNLKNKEAILLLQKICSADNKLENLSFSNNKLSTEVVSYICEAINSSHMNLMYLNLEGNLFTEEDKRTIENAMKI